MEGGGREGGEGGKGSEEERGGERGEEGRVREKGRGGRKGGEGEREGREEGRGGRKGGERGREGGSREEEKQRRKGEQCCSVYAPVHTLRDTWDTYLQASRYPLMMEVGWILNLTSCSACFKSSAATITYRSGHKVKWDTSTQVLYCPEHAPTSM